MRPYILRSAGPLALAAVFVTVTPARPQTWTPTVSGNWNVPSNWSTMAVPVSGPTTQLVFPNFLNGGYTATNNIGINPFVLNGLTIQNEAAGTVILTNAAGNGLRLAGADPFIVQAGLGPAFISGTTLDLAASAVVGGPGDGTLTIASRVTGPGGLTINRTSPSFEAVTELNSTTANSFAGGVTLQSGRLSVSSTAGLGSGPLTVNTTGAGLAATGDLRSSGPGVTLPNPVTIAAGGTLNVPLGNITFVNSVSGGGLQVGTDLLFAEVALQATSGLTAVAMASGTLTLRNTGAIPTGGLTIPVGRSVLALSNTAANLADRLAPTTTLALSSSTFTINANATAGNSASQTLAAITGEGRNTITVTPSVANPAALAVGNLGRVNRGSFTVTGTGLGGTPGTANVATVTFGTVNGAAPAAALVGGGGPAGSTTVSIFPFVISGITLATYDAANGVRPLSTATEYAPLSLARQANPPANNVRLTTNQPGVTQSTIVNALALNGAGVFGSGGLTVASGAVLGAGTVATATLDFGAAEGHLLTDTVVYSQVTGSNGLTISGNAQILNPANSFTGPVTIQGGTVVIPADAALGNAANPVVLNGGTLDVQAVGATISRPISVGGDGRVWTGSLDPSGVGPALTLSGDVSGSGLLRLNVGATGAPSPGTIVLTGNNAGFAGEMAINGVVQVDSDARLGAGSRLFINGTLMPTASFATDRTIDFAFGGFRTDAGVTLTLNGRLNPFRLPSLGKLGAGTLVLTTNVAGAPNEFSPGGVDVGLSTSRLVGGDLILQDGGAVRSFGFFSIREGSRIVLANAAVNLSNRLPNGSGALSGGVLRLEGNAAGPTTESIGPLTIRADTGNSIQFAPSGGQAATLVIGTNLATNPLTVANGGSLVVSGSGLGLAGTSRLQFQSSTAPTLQNNILPGVFGHDGTNPGMVTTGPVTGGLGLRLLDPATEYASSFAAAGTAANVRITAAETVSAAGTKTVNSAFIDGTTLTINAGATVVMTPGGNLIMTPGSSIAGSGTVRFARVYAPGAATDTVTIGTAFGTVGNQSLSKTGPARLELTGASPLLTTLNVQEGTVILAASGSIATTATVFPQAGATLDLGGVSRTVGTLNGLGTVQLGSNPAMVLSVGAGSFGGTVLGSGSIAKTGTGTLALGPAADVPQPITVSGGTLFVGDSDNVFATPLAAGEAITLANAATLSISDVLTFSRDVNVNVGATTGTATVNLAGVGRVTGTFLVAANKTLNFTMGSQHELAGAITGGGAVTYSSGGSVTIAGNNSYTGPTTVTSRIIGIGSDTAFGGGAVTLNQSTLTLATYNGPRTLANPLTVTQDFTMNGPFDLVFTGPTTLAGAGTTRTATVAGSGRLGLTAVAPGATATRLVKAGGGSLTLAGNSTYGGGTTVTAGSLFLLSGAQLSGGGAVTVGGAAGSSRAVFGGSGAIAGSMTLNATGTLSPGASAGELTMNNGLTFAAGSTYLWELTANSTVGPGTTWDRVSQTGGALTINPAAVFLPSFIDGATVPSLAEPFWQSVQRWDNVINLTGTATVGGGTSFLINNSMWAAAGSFSTVPAVVGSGVALQWTPVPEPALPLLLAATVAVLARVRRPRLGGHRDDGRLFV